MRAFKAICVLVLGALTLTACDGGADVTPTDTAIAETSNSPPAINGTPGTSVAEGTAYSFTPSASDPDGDALHFSISNLPPWASFDNAMGTLSGTPSSAAVGTYSGIVISVSDGQATASLPSFSIQVTAAGGNTPLTIGGSPLNAITVGTNYSFTPTVSGGSSGAALQFSVSNAPPWATFNSSTGQLTGTPQAANVGTYSNIMLSVSDGSSSASLPAFSIAVTQTAAGTASLHWTTPTRNTDGTPLTGLAGFTIRYGTDSTNLGTTVTIANPLTDAFVVQNLTAATWYFAISDYTASGVQSALSNVGTKTIN